MVAEADNSDSIQNVCLVRCVEAGEETPLHIVPVDSEGNLVTRGGE